VPPLLPCSPPFQVPEHFLLDNNDFFSIYKSFVQILMFLRTRTDLSSSWRANDSDFLATQAEIWIFYIPSAPKLLDFAGDFLLLFS
jgi:hypothetical protein